MVLRLAMLVVSFWLFSPFAGAPARADTATAPAASPASSPSPVDDAALDLLRKEIAAPSDECRCAARKAGLRERVKEHKLERERREQQSAD